MAINCVLYYNIAHVRANRMPPLGVDKTILSPPKRSLSPPRGDSSISQLFLFRSHDASWKKNCIAGSLAKLQKKDKITIDK